MMKRLIIVLLLVSLGLKAQPPKKFYARFGGSGVDIGYSIAEGSDHQYVIVGSTSSYGNGGADAYMLLVDTMGDLKWQKTFGGAGTDVAKSVAFNKKDSGFVFAGYTTSFGNGGYDIFVVRTDKKGDLIWQKTFGGLDWDFGTGVSFLADGNVVFCANSFNLGLGKQDAMAVKLDISNGSIMWQKNFGGKEDDAFNSVITDRNNNLYLLGSTGSFGEPNGDLVCYKLNSNGDSLMALIYGGSLRDKANSGVIDTLGNIYICGGSESFSNGKLDALYIKFSPTGTVLWRKYYGLAGEDEESFKIVLSTSPSIGESIAVYTTNEFPLLGKDSKTIYLTFGGDYYGGGFSGSFGFGKNDELFDLITTHDKGYLQVGYTESIGDGNSDVFLVKRDSTLDRGSIIAGIEKSAVTNGPVTGIFPNPLGGSQGNMLYVEGLDNATDCRLIIYSVSGAELCSGNIEPGKGFDLGPLNMQPGVYFVRLTSGNKTYYGKLIKQ